MPPAPPAPPHSPTVIEVSPSVRSIVATLTDHPIDLTFFKDVHLVPDFETRSTCVEAACRFMLVLMLGIILTYNHAIPVSLLSLLGLYALTLVSTPVQIFMAWRIRIITEKNLPVAFISVLSLTSFAGSIWLTVSVSNSPQFAKFDSFRAAPILWLVGSAVADIAISICLVYSLSKGRKYQNAILGIERGLNDRIHRIIRATIATGMLTTLTALVDAIVFLIKPDTTIFFSWDLTLCKLYTITLLISFNGRHLASDEDYEPNALGFSTCSETLSQMSFSQNIRSSMGSVPKTPGDGLEELYELSPRN
ncbi:hypothetical protein F5880DRAFT_1733128 [Lentinula raphanica]|nr:hypothetical protein F5880DRAFT_1733128 [Lentinula raphanica]